MAFSKGKRIVDETSKRIVDLAVNIGCREGADALTVTRLCKELSCDRRVIYNRFRDVDEINMVVAQLCNEELMENARTVVDSQVSFYDNFMAVIKAAFAYIYEKNAYFQQYTTFYRVTEAGLKNEIYQSLTDMIEDGKAAGEVRAETDSCKSAESIWIIMTGISGMLASNVNYKYQDGLDTVLYGVEAILSCMRL